MEPGLRSSPLLFPPIDILTEILRAIDTLVVAFSGGVDSTFLLLYARKIFAEGDPNGRDYAAASGSAKDIDDGTRHEGSDNKRNKLLAVTADGPNFVPDEIAYAQKLCRVNDIEHMCIDLSNRLLEKIKGNTPERCYICKKYIFADIIEKVILGSVETIAATFIAHALHLIAHIREALVFPGWAWQGIQCF